MTTRETEAAFSEADGFVVCTRWNGARTRSGSFAYEHYERLADAVAAYRNPGMDFTAHGIFASKDGLPVGPALDVQTVITVTPGEKRRYGLREWSPVTPEHMALRERARQRASSEVL